MIDNPNLTGFIGKSLDFFRRKTKIDKEILLANMDRIHSTSLGILRIKRNLQLETEDIIHYCKRKIKDKNCPIYKKGKNWYCEIENIKITINAFSYTIITAHKMKY